MPQSGDYLILVDGYSVPAGTGKFDMGKLIIQGTQLIPTNVPGSGIPSGTNAHFNVTWNFAGTLPGFYIGIMFVGPTGAPAVEVDALFALFDANPPVILSTTPTDGSSTNDASARITVSYVDPQISAGIVDATIEVDGTDFSFFGTFNETTLLWSLPFSFSEGAHTVTVQVFDGVGFSANITWRFTVDTMAPSLSVTSPDYALTRNATTTVSGTTEVGATVTVNGATTGVNATTGAFSRTIHLGEGPNTAVATDPAGNQAQLTRTIDVGAAPDTTAPVVTVTSPADGASVDQASVVVSGTVDDATSTVRVNGVDVHPAADGSWSVTIALVAGSNTISVTATDAAGNQGTAVTRSVTYHSPVPGINQAVTSLSGNLVLGLAIVVVVLVAIVFALSRNLNRKIGNLKPRPPEPPEGGMP